MSRTFVDPAARLGQSPSYSQDPSTTAWLDYALLVTLVVMIAIFAITRVSGIG